MMSKNLYLIHQCLTHKKSLKQQFNIKGLKELTHKHLIKEINLI